MDHELRGGRDVGACAPELTNAREPLGEKTSVQENEKDEEDEEE